MELFSITFLSLLLNLLTISIILFLLIYKNTKSIDNHLTFPETYSEIRDFSLKIITRSILERLLVSEHDANGSKIALKDISSISEPFYHGVIVSVIGNMSEDLKKKFFHFFKRTKDDSALIVEVSAMIEIYSIDIAQRLKFFETDANNANKLNISNNKRPVEVRDYVYGMLINSIVNDIKFLNGLKTINNK